MAKTTITLRDLKTQFNRIARHCKSKNSRLSLSRVFQVLSGGNKKQVKYLCDTTVESTDGKTYKGVNVNCTKGELVQDIERKDKELERKNKELEQFQTKQAKTLKKIQDQLQQIEDTRAEVEAHAQTIAALIRATQQMSPRTVTFHVVVAMPAIKNARTLPITFAGRCWDAQPCLTQRHYLSQCLQAAI